MAARTDPLGWSLRHTLHQSPFEGVPGLLRLHHVQHMFERHASGQGRDRAVNQRAFQAFCEEMGMVNPEMTRRLFLAIDDDNTGAVEAHEFLRAVRLMCDDSSGDGMTGWQKQRMKFAFNLFDEDRAGVISGAQIRTVLKTFYSEARHVLVELMGQIEDIYGMDIAVVSTRGTTYKVRWSEEPSLQRVFASLEKKLADERWRMVDYSLDFREQGQVDGLSFNGFCKWCSTNNDRSRLRMLEWMKVLGGLWLQRMGLAKHANDPVQHHHPAACKHKHPGRFHPQHHAYPPARSEFQVSKIPMLGQVFHRLTQAQLTKAFGRANAFGIRTGALDNFVVGANQSASGNLGRYENALELSEAEFERCLTRLGVKHPPLQKRFFKVFERRLQKEHYGRSTPIVGAFGFIEPREFMAGLQLLMLRDRDEKFDMVFKMFDVQGRGFIGEAEMHRLINLFFLVAHDAVRSIIHTFEYLLGKDVAMEKEIRAAGARLQRHYADVVTQAVFSNLAPDGPDSVKRLDLSELKQWSAENGGRLRDWFDCLGYHWLASIEKTVPEIDGLAVVPEGLLLNLMGAYDMDPERPLSDDEHYKMLQRSMWNAKSDSAFKAESQKQPNGYSSGAPAIPPPNCTFQPSKVKAIQVLFSKLGGADGVMSSLEWKRCLSAAGVYNEWVSDRLFALFDSSGDQEMNAKEFTWGLSDICSEAPHPGTKMTPFEVRQAFAYRFYDTDLSGYFEKDECKQFLLSWQQACDLAVTRALDKFVRVFGLGKEYLQTMEAEQDIVADRKRIAELGDEIQRELIRFNDELFVLFTGTYGTRMNYENFKEFTKKSPIAVDWLTDLGTHLQKQFPTLSGMTFDDSDPKIDPHATELSQARMRKSFRACSTKGVMRANDLVKLLQKQGVSTNEFFGKLLFRVIDGDGNGTVTEDEFVDAMTRTIMGTPEERLRTVYRMVDTTKAGFVSSKALRAFLQSWFDMALEQVQSVASGLDEWLNGRVTTTGHTLSSSGPPRVGGLNAQLFVPSSRQPKPRDANLEVPVNMRKKSSSRVSLLVDYMVDEAMDFAQSSNLSKGKHLYSDEFTQWLSNRTQFIDWLARIGAQWMVTPKQADEENDASKVGPAARRPVRRTDAVAIPTKAPVDPLAAVITAADIGRSISSVVYTATTGEPDFGAELQAEVASGPGSKWWARSLRDRAHVRPSQLRPATHFDSIDLADIEAVFASDVAARRIYDKAKFRTKLRHERLKFKSTLVMDKLYSMFDVNGDGLLDVEEAGCGLVLLATGETVERRRLAFDLFDVGKNDDIQEQDMRVFLRAFTRVAMEVMSSMLERLSELFGPEPKSSREKKDDEEYRMKLLKRAVEKLEAATEQMIRVAFAADVNQDRSLSWQEFELWAEENPTFSTWMEQLGLSCLESIATTEDRSVPHVGGERPVPSTFRARRKYPNGTSFERLRVYQVRAIFGSYATFGQLNPDRFAACLHKLKVYSPYTVRRLFALFDRDGGGDVSMREFASGFFLLCGGGLEEKLAEAFVLYDDDGNGFLDGQEMRSLFESFYTIAMDVVCCSLSTSTAVLQADRSFDDIVLELSHDRVTKYLALQQKELAQFCARDRGKYFFAEFYQWAEQDNDFLRWLESLRNLWYESIMQYEEAHTDKGGSDGAADAYQPHTLPNQIVRRKVITFPPVQKGEIVAPEGVYAYPFIVKQTYAVTIKRGGSNARHGKKLQYTNPYGEPLRLSLSTDHPELLTLPQNVYTLEPLGLARLILEFEMHPQHLHDVLGGSGSGALQADATTHYAQVRLWVHNESAARNEECIIFNCSYLTEYESKLHDAERVRRAV